MRRRHHRTAQPLIGVGAVTGDKLPDLVVRTGTAFWLLSGYADATFRTAAKMGENAVRANSEIVNIADVELHSTPDMTLREGRDHYGELGDVKAIA
ncbi:MULTISPECIES: hypothetical protein [Actinoplanes]|uniref:hypothetical protein n=1 Tax=Actinoplanes TaxID=1865 RepID=UPI0005F2DB8A|nr:MULTISPECIES: hypothetical protein [Actinoplanes]GLY02253.1 hypothetical protein Acsp01_26320 [Actinoplanes sp. NBRC 101535]